MSELENTGIVRSELLFGKVNAIYANYVQFEFTNINHQAN